MTTCVCVVLVLRGRPGGEGFRHNRGVGTSDRVCGKRAGMKASKIPETDLRAVRVTSSPDVPERWIQALFHLIGNGFQERVW